MPSTGISFKLKRLEPIRNDASSKKLLSSKSVIPWILKLNTYEEETLMLNT